MEATRVPPSSAAPVGDVERPAVLRPELANVVALSTDGALLDQLRDAVENRYRLWRAENVSHAAELTIAANQGVLLLDSAVTAPDTADIVVRLRKQFPALCVLVAGRRDDEAQLAALISSGDVYRFLHKPLSVERARTFIEAAVRRQQSTTDAAAPGSRSPQPRAEIPPRQERAAPPAVTVPRASRPLRPLAIALGLAAIGAIGWILASRDEAPPQAAIQKPASSADPAGATGTAATLAAAGKALAAGRLIEPPGENAVQLFRSVLTSEPGNPAAVEGLRQTGQLLLDRAEQAFATGDLPAAANHLDGARLADPESPRLRDLTARMDKARAALNAPPPPGNISKLDPNAVSLSRQQEARALIGRARTRMSAGDLSDGPQSAAALLTAARQANPGDPQVAREFERLGDLLLERARTALDARRFAEVQRWMAAADALDTHPAELQRLRAELDTARKLAGREDNLRLLTLANQRIAQDRLIDPEGDSARHYLDMLRAADGNFPGLAEAGQTLSARALAALPELLKARRWSDAERMLQAAAAQRSDPASLREASESLQRARSAVAAPAEPPLVPENSLQRTQAVAARYPSRASDRGVEGTVEAEITIGTDGTPRKITILTSNPPGVFDQAVIDAVRQWRYRPVEIDGRVTEVRTRARLRFKLADR